jgi:hypothetical protein
MSNGRRLQRKRHNELWEVDAVKAPVKFGATGADDLN